LDSAPRIKLCLGPNSNLAGRQSSDKLKGGASLTFNGRNDHLELLIEAGIKSIKYISRFCFKFWKIKSAS